DSTLGSFELPGIVGRAALVCHPGPTVGYRLAAEEGSLAYLPDHEPALGVRSFPEATDWTSGWGLAHNVDLLVHDAQYTEEEYAGRLGAPVEAAYEGMVVDLSGEESTGERRKESA